MAKILRSRSIRTAIPAALAIALMAAPGHANASAAASESALPAGQVAESVNYLTSTYRITTSEALRRLMLQREAPRLNNQLAEQFPDSFAGTWIDQDHGGVLVVGTTQPKAMTDALAGEPLRDHMKIVSVKYPRRNLEQTATLLQTRLAPSIEVTVDDVHDRVVVYGTSLPSRFSALAGTGIDPGMVVFTPAVQSPEPAACTRATCSPPIRGGVAITMANEDKNHNPIPVAGCTSGFDVAGSNGWHYVLTAGHCFLEVGANFSLIGSTWLGQKDSRLTSDQYPQDGAIMPFRVIGSTNYVNTWEPAGSPKNRVFTAKNALYPITGMYTFDQIGVGWVVCAEGATRGTNCGTVHDKDTGGIRTDICVQAGDSGGPLYSQVDQRAYGVTQGADNASKCYTGNLSWFSPLSKIFAMATANTGITFGVETK